jgi:hypothetical protein
MVYNPNTGECRDDRQHATLTEDFWFPKKGDGRGSEVTTLAGGQNLSEIDDVVYFQKNLYKSLNIPLSRLDPTNGFNIGKSAEITREEIKFSKFITQLRFKFSQLFNQILKKQLILTGVTTESDWEYIKECIYYDFLSDSHYAELKELEMHNNRLDALSKVADFTNSEDKIYYSKKWVARNLLKLSDADIEEIKKELVEESQKEEEPAPEAPAEGEDMGNENPPEEAGPSDEDVPAEELPLPTEEPGNEEQ